MKNRKVKDHDSDDETENKIMTTMTHEQIEAQQLDSAALIPDSEISPAAIIFQ